MGILGELWVKLGLKSEKFKQGMDGAKKQIQGFASSMKKLGGIIGAAFTVEKIVAFTHQAAELANKATGVKKAFDKLNSPGLLADLRKATMGTVDDLQLMQRAVQANNFKIPLEQLATYLEFATKRASETGESVDYLVDSIITGLGRQSVMILDNLGISAAEIRDRMKEGGTMADAVGKIIKEQMGEGAAEIDKAAQATQRLQAAWTNFQLAFGEGTKGPLNWIKGKAAEKLEELTTIFNSDSLTTFGKFAVAFSPLMRILGVTDKIVTEEAEKAAAALEKLKKETEEYKRLVESGEFVGPMIAEENELKKGLIGQLKEEIQAKEQLKELSANKSEVMQLNDEIAALKEKLRILQMTTEEYKKYQASLDRSFTPVAIDGIFDKAKIKANTNIGIESINTALKQYRDKGAEMANEAVRQQQMLDQMNEHFNASIVAGISGGVEELARAIAGVEGANLGTVAQALLTPMADALAAAGEMIIAEGIAVEAFKESLKSLNGPVAIAAGAALVAVAGAVKAGLQSIGNNPTGAGGYANTAVTSYSGGYGVNSANYQAANDFTLTTELKGENILLSIERTQNKRRR